jgi:hypothetical protein
VDRSVGSKASGFEVWREVLVARHQDVMCGPLAQNTYRKVTFYILERNADVKNTYPPMKMEQSVPKRRHIQFRRRGITQKKAYSIQKTAKVCNQELKKKYVNCKRLLINISQIDAPVYYFIRSGLINVIILAESR